jgi:hypothetical protein
MNIIHTDKLKIHSQGHDPRSLKEAAPNNVFIHVSDVSGKTNPPWNYGMIHSKMLISDK